MDDVTAADPIDDEIAEEMAEVIVETATEAAIADAVIEEAADEAAAEVLEAGLEEAAEIVESGIEAAEIMQIAAAGDGVEQEEVDAEVEAILEEAGDEALEVIEDAVEGALEIEEVAAEAIEEIDAAAVEVIEAVAEEAIEEAIEEAGAAEVAAEEAPAEEEPVRARSPFDGPGDWYVVHTYSGYENRVKTNLSSRIHTMQMQDKIFDVQIPMEDVMEIKGGKKQVVKKKVFPGYLLVSMIYDNDSWYVVRNTPGVTGFVSSGTGAKPTPLTRREVEKILMVKEAEAKPTLRLEWDEGDVVRIISGPFADFNGTISEINVDQSKLKVLVNIFDRETPVELGFDQVAKV